jgi:hypothetical protein
MPGAKTRTLPKLGKTELVTIDPPIPEVLDSPPLGGLESTSADPVCGLLLAMTGLRSEQQHADPRRNI